MLRIPYNVLFTIILYAVHCRGFGLKHLVQEHNNIKPLMTKDYKKDLMKKPHRLFFTQFVVKTVRT